MQVSEKAIRELTVAMQANLEAQKPAQIWLDEAVVQLVNRGIPADLVAEIEAMARFLIGTFYARGWDDPPFQVRAIVNELERTILRLREEQNAL